MYNANIFILFAVVCQCLTSRINKYRLCNQVFLFSLCVCVADDLYLLAACYFQHRQQFVFPGELTSVHPTKLFIYSSGVVYTFLVVTGTIQLCLNASTVALFLNTVFLNQVGWEPLQKS